MVKRKAIPSRVRDQYYGPGAVPALPSTPTPATPNGIVAAAFGAADTPVTMALGTPMGKGADTTVGAIVTPVGKVADRPVTPMGKGADSPVAVSLETPKGKGADKPVAVSLEKPLEKSTGKRPAAPLYGTPMGKSAEKKGKGADADGEGGHSPVAVSLDKPLEKAVSLDKPMEKALDGATPVSADKKPLAGKRPAAPLYVPGPKSGSPSFRNEKSGSPGMLSGTASPGDRAAKAAKG